MLDSHAPGRRWLRICASLAAVGLVAAACGGGGGGDGRKGAQFEGRPSDEGTPQRGGSVVYGLEAETGGGWCLPNAQLAAGGIQIATAIYDTLVAPASDGEGGVEYAPYLAESVEHNDTYDEWTIQIREGVTFHDGTPLTAEIVKQNLDAFRGVVEGVAAPLFSFVFEKVSDVTVVDDVTVRVTTEIPWVAFNAFLWGTGRVGMVAPAQLADPETCNRNLIGTGPFRFVEWTVNDKLVGERWENYWREDENGEQLPYIDRIEFRPVVDVAQRVNGLKGGELDLIHTTDGIQINNLRRDAEAGTISLLESDFAPETTYTMLNTSKAPFDNRNARLAAAHAINSEEFIDIIQAGVVNRSVQPFGDDNIAYVPPRDLGYPEYNPDKAREFVQAYEDETGQDLSFSILSTTDPNTVKLAQLHQSQLEEAGMTVGLDQVEQTQIINTALGNNFQAVLWRNHPGGDPDTQYVWWYSTIENGNPNFVNFSRIDDEELDDLFTRGRSETDPAERAEIYKGISRVFAEEAYNLWNYYTLWAFAYASDVHGVFPPNLPGGEEPLIIASVQPVVGLWRG